MHFIRFSDYNCIDVCVGNGMANDEILPSADENKIIKNSAVKSSDITFIAFDNLPFINPNMAINYAYSRFYSVSWSKFHVLILHEMLQIIFPEPARRCEPWTWRIVIFCNLFSTCIIQANKRRNRIYVDMIPLVI